jgi:hypothetical protein
MDFKPLQASKTFRYPLGHVAHTTCTVAELREFLTQFPADMPVMGAWEGQVRGLSHPGVEPIDWGFEADREDVLILDAELA